MNKEKKYSSVHYADYLELDKLLHAQHPRSGDENEPPAHDEMLFIIVHQVYELWFKQIIHELKSLQYLFQDHHVNDNHLGLAISRLERIIEIQKLLIQQMTVMETLSPLDFLDFREYLFPASGFQSFQFREVEVMMGLKQENRTTYNEKSYQDEFNSKQKDTLNRFEKESLFDIIQNWLERTPFLQFKGFDFLTQYKSAVQYMIRKEQEQIDLSPFLDDAQKKQRLEMLGNTETYYKMILDPEYHEKLREEGKVRMSYKATMAALLINLYRDEPLLHQPYKLLLRLTEIDENFSTWRYRHAQMVLRMLGNKIGTGGSSGYDYLMKTVLHNHMFKDLHNISTMMIPRSELPELPNDVKKELGFYYQA